MDEEGFIASTATMTGSQMLEMRKLACLYNAVSNCGILRYPLLWLQWERGLDAVGLLHELVCGSTTDTLFPMLQPLLAEESRDMIGPSAAISQLSRMRAQWEACHTAFARWVSQRFAIDLDAPFRCILTAQSAVMPADDLAAGAVKLPFDVVAWYGDRREGVDRPLDSYGPCTLLGEKTSMAAGWHFELPSPLSRIRQLARHSGTG